jgi:hypothetical protein
MYGCNELRVTKFQFYWELAIYRANGLGEKSADAKLK